ncbi:bifunctional uridylyltransferase/uridylyl-removing protein [Haemophilus influenzae]|uniref:Bifunctional uridylyltransferase/uridylyl-removing enzyme n=1 Tax=Haemophilus influenzae (strain ATCC 51907 / DSM 11121 / KW20 / Rd) TaxID=71421 RepID=GLND_HAEIN|nr:bifunctional uridylyltransferase/uridylyl-removing protein GlnD [Haemophilus influenzae]P43919.1 RecName: Full=Bifunctional uridylyltransferase/uridylyl-removing enzyme; Short=UTase/UR; AltName: Full=Bifunctional [protein-PII] modification enzyme; AltName: Full=Bifunctional nitrogen sensor protein; Includes: RecName: Full=[Protein-PII] uridylyltransferase; Short=PII uridylyltransferase; Short=UTase; Includes: RecName: Full=[Protein-PII]-UMP uridylyl-removing enzyme; Short=UR [Haemophilus influe
MLFSPTLSSLLTPSAVKIERENLKQFELENFSCYSIFELIENRCDFYDALLIQLWQEIGLSEQQGISLIAVGGYGRREMFPLSDLDFLILVEQTPSHEIEEKITQFIQFLWDCGFEVGNSVRTLEQCELEGKQDITIATNLLEARFLTGNRPHFDVLNELVKRADFWSKEDFFNAKVQEQIERYQRYHNTAYNLEPDIKFSPGGLRDLHLLYWVALRHSGALTLEAILQSGFIYPQEYQQLQESRAFLFKVRFALHLILKRYDNRLLFDRQIKVSELLGFRGEGNPAVEKMMKCFFQALHRISLISNLLIQHYRENVLSSNQDTVIDQLDDDFQLINQSLCLRNSFVFQEKPARILDLFFYLTQYEHVNIHSDTLRQLQISLEQLSQKLCEIPAAREKFLRLFNQSNAIKRAFMPMHQYGVLTAYLPQWQAIEGLMQFDLFHIYTVDEHTLRVMLKLESFLPKGSAQEHPIAHRIFSQLSDRTLLYIAALFHDIAKGRGGDHAELGAEDVADFAQLHGLDRREIDTLAWLVQSHLLMSITAQRRDIHDPEVVMNFAEAMQNQVRLDYLTCLTVADICATNGNLWNSWKRSLFASLYEFTEQQFSQGMKELLDYSEKSAENRKLAQQILTQDYSDITSISIEKLWTRCPEDYFVRNTPKQIAWHTSLLVDFVEALLVKISNRFSLGGTEVFIYCQDQPHLFNKVVSTIGAKKFSIHDAQIITTQDGYVFDSFIITELNGELVEFDRRRELEQALTVALQSEKLPALSIVPNRQLQHFTVQTDVRFLQENKKEHTEMELVALDKAGLLAQVSQIFTELNLNLLNAKITTVGEKAEDFFILTNQFGQALAREERERLNSVIIQQIR